MLNRPAIPIVASKNQLGGEPCKAQIANLQIANPEKSRHFSLHTATAQFPNSPIPQPPIIGFCCLRCFTKEYWGENGTGLRNSY